METLEKITAIETSSLETKLEVLVKMFEDKENFNPCKDMNEDKVISLARKVQDICETADGMIVGAFWRLDSSVDNWTSLKYNLVDSLGDHIAIEDFKNAFNIVDSIINYLESHHLAPAKIVECITEDLTGYGSNPKGDLGTFKQVNALISVFEHCKTYEDACFRKDVEAIASAIKWRLSMLDVIGMDKAYWVMNDEKTYEYLKQIDQRHGRKKGFDLFSI